MDKIDLLADLACRIIRTDLMIAECDRIIEHNRETINRIDKILNGTTSNTPASSMALQR